MQLDTRLPLMAAQQPAIQFQPETRLESLGKIAPAINAMRQMQTQQVDMEKMQQRSAALDQLRVAAKGKDLNIFADALIASNVDKLVEEGAKLKRAILEDFQFKQQYGGMTGNLTAQGMAALAGAGERGLGIAKELGQYVVKPQPFGVGKNVYVPGQGFETPPETPTNALTAAAPAVTADPRARYLAARGYEIGEDGKARPIPGGPADPARMRQQAEARAAARPSSGEVGGAVPAAKPMSESELARRRDAVAKEYRNAGTALQNLQETLNSADQVRKAPGLERATGYSGALLPSFPGGAAAQAQTRLENLRGKITAMGKATAAMSGAIGSIANQEWKILADQIAVIDPVKGVGPMLEQIASLEQQARAAMGRIKDAYGKQYSEDFERFPQFRELPMPAQGAGIRAPAASTSPPPASTARPTGASGAPAQGNLSPAEKTELEALRRRFGRPQ